MRAYPDTSFLFAFYLKQSNSPAAAAYAAGMKEALQVGPPLRYEFRQAVRFQVWRNKTNPVEGVTIDNARTALKQFEQDLQDGIALLVQCDSNAIFKQADALSQKHTMLAGHRAFDVIHVATALVLQASEFLTFDGNQRKLALAEGLKVLP